MIPLLEVWPKVWIIARWASTTRRLPSALRPAVFCRESYNPAEDPQFLAGTDHIRLDVTVHIS